MNSHGVEPSCHFGLLLRARVFQITALYKGQPDQEITIENLKKILLSHFPSMRESRMLDAVSNVFDVDGNGKVDFEEASGDVVSPRLFKSI